MGYGGKTRLDIRFKTWQWQHGKSQVACWFIPRISESVNNPDTAIFCFRTGFRSNFCAKLEEIIEHCDLWSKKTLSVKQLSPELNLAVAVGSATEHDSIQDFTEKEPVDEVIVLGLVSSFNSRVLGQRA